MVKISKHIPNTLTILNIAIGLASVILTYSGEYSKAAGLILVSVIVDTFDGYIARMLKSTSRFGSYMDTVADFISYGIATPFMMMRVFNVPAGFALLFGVSSIFRLVYFMKTKNPSFFYGVPTTVAGGFLATTVLLRPNTPFMSELMVGLSLLMLSRKKYYRVDLKSRKTMSVFVLILLSMVALGHWTFLIEILSFMFLSYIIFGWLKIKEAK